MCNEYARRRALDRLGEEFSQRGLPSFRWQGHQIPNDLTGKESVRINDLAPIARLHDGELVGSMMKWAWRAPRGKPVFNFVSEKRDFSRSERVLVFADGFYEFTAPATKVKLKDKHLFTLKGEPWFWIAAVVQEGCFALLTTAPGPDIAPYHDRQIVTLPAAAGLEWLTLSRRQDEILRAPPAGSLQVTTIRRDGQDLAA